MRSVDKQQESWQPIQFQVQTDKEQCALRRCKVTVRIDLCFLVEESLPSVAQMPVFSPTSRTFTPTFKLASNSDNCPRIKPFKNHQLADWNQNYQASGRRPDRRTKNQFKSAINQISFQARKKQSTTYNQDTLFQHNQSQDMRKDQKSTTKDGMLDAKQAMLVTKKTFEEDAVICSSKPLLYPRNMDAVQSARKFKGTHQGSGSNQRRPTANGIGKKRHRNRNRNRGSRGDQPATQILGALNKMQTEYKKSLHRKKDFARVEELLLRPLAPHNTTQYLSHNYNCRVSRRDLSLRQHSCLSLRPALFLNVFREASIPAQPLNAEKENKQHDPTIFYTLDGSQQSTTAGETSSDEDLRSSRLQIPGLTMQGIADYDMFEVNLDDDSPSFQDESTNDSDMREEDLYQTLASLNFQIASLQKELVLKSYQTRSESLS